MDVEVAVKHIKTGDCVFVGAFGAQPIKIENELIRQKERLKSLTIVQSTVFGQTNLVTPGLEKYFRFISLFSTRDVRTAIKEGRAEYVPCFFYEQPEYIEKYCPPDVACIQVSPPDNNGFCSLGVSVDVARKAVECSKTVDRKSVV